MAIQALVLHCGRSRPTGPIPGRNRNRPGRYSRRRARAAFLAGVLDHLADNELADGLCAGIGHSARSILLRPATCSPGRAWSNAIRHDPSCHDHGLLPRLPRRKPVRAGAATPAARRASLRHPEIARPRRSPMSIATPSTRRSRSATIHRSRDKPLIIGGGTRGVVSTACYIARTYGRAFRDADVQGAAALPGLRR